MSMSFKFSPQKPPRSLSLPLTIAVSALFLFLLTFRGTLPTLTVQASSLTTRSAISIGAFRQPKIVRFFLYDHPMRILSTTITIAVFKFIKAHLWELPASLSAPEGYIISIIENLWI